MKEKETDASFKTSDDSAKWINSPDLFKYYKIVDNYYYQLVDLFKVGLMIYLIYKTISVCCLPLWWVAYRP